MTSPSFLLVFSFSFFFNCVKGDKEIALQAVLAGDAVDRSRELARWHAQVRIYKGCDVTCIHVLLAIIGLSPHRCAPLGMCLDPFFEDFISFFLCSKFEGHLIRFVQLRCATIGGRVYRFIPSSVRVSFLPFRAQQTIFLSFLLLLLQLFPPPRAPLLVP